LPEFGALLFGLVVYTAAFIAEVVRAGLLSVSRGQTEAAAALGLRRRQILNLIVIPQAKRVIIPPLTNQYLNLTKNSSLAVAIGYPTLFRFLPHRAQSDRASGRSRGDHVRIVFGAKFDDLRRDELVQRARRLYGTLRRC
jgi:ABC-type amino acid transport system permease subunit